MGTEQHSGLPSAPPDRCEPHFTPLPSTPGFRSPSARAPYWGSAGCQRAPRGPESGRSTGWRGGSGGLSQPVSARARGAGRPPRPASGQRAVTTCRRRTRGHSRRRPGPGRRPHRAACRDHSDARGDGPPRWSPPHPVRRQRAHGRLHHARLPASARSRRAAAATPSGHEPSLAPAPADSSCTLGDPHATCRDHSPGTNHHPRKHETGPARRPTPFGGVWRIMLTPSATDSGSLRLSQRSFIRSMKDPPPPVDGRAEPTGRGRARSSGLEAVRRTHARARARTGHRRA